MCDNKYIGYIKIVACTYTLLNNTFETGPVVSPSKREMDLWRRIISASPSVLFSAPNREASRFKTILATAVASSFTFIE